MSTEHEDLLVELKKAEETRYFGKYPGTVTHVDDPDGLLRIRAMVPDVFGKEEPSPWAWPALPFAGPQQGLAMLPEVGSGVWIEFACGRLEDPIWSGCFWASGQLPEDATEKARLLRTAAGHQILIDEAANVIKLEHPDGPTTITLSAGEITLKVQECELKITSSEITLNKGMVKVTMAGASLVNDALKLGG